ncbi:MAG: amino acid adenylation domain-containing protein [Pseudomonadales bacterium]
MRTFLIQHLLQQSAIAHPDKIAVVCGKEEISYQQLDERSSQLANVLIRLGVQFGDRVGIQLAHSIDSVISLFGILKAAAVYVPIDPLSPVERARHIVNNCTLQCVITSADVAAKTIALMGKETPLRNVLLTGKGVDALKADIPGFITHTLNEECAKESNTAPEFSISDSHPAYILHTSGSTGVPKGVVIAHQNSLSFVDMIADRFDFTECDRVASHAPLHFDLSVFDVFTALKCSGTVVMVPKRYSVFPKELAKYISEQKISVWNSVASVIALLAENGKLEEFDFEALRLVHFSGEVLAVRHLKIAMRAMPKASFVNQYGQTEANSTMCYPIEQLPDSPNQKMPIGNAMPGCEVFALNAEGTEISAAGEEGELHIKSSTIALGYWSDTALTTEKFITDPRDQIACGRVYKTGDLVTLNEHGEYIMLGRKDALIKSRGYRIDLGEVESVLYHCDAVEVVAAIAVPHDLIGNEIVVYLRLKDSSYTVEKLFEHCAAYLPQYMLPKAIELVKELPYTSTGKIDKKTLREQALVN